MVTLCHSRSPSRFGGFAPRGYDYSRPLGELGNSGSGSLDRGGVSADCNGRCVQFVSAIAASPGRRSNRAWLTEKPVHAMVIPNCHIARISK
jgi:hypothetical protein